MKKIVSINSIGTLGQSLFNASGILMSVLILYNQVRRGVYLEQSKTFSLVSILFMLGFHVNIFTFWASQNSQQVLAIFQRIGSVMILEEKTEKDNERVDQPSIDIKNAAFTWGFKVKKDKNEAGNQEGDVNLDKVTVNAKTGETLCVIGQVGSGKTTMLYSLMKETSKLSGDVKIEGKCVYVEQEPFIFSATVTENICFGCPFDKERFEAVVDACQLRRDIETQFEQGVDTIIGERGVNISGGQKARLSLARACYSDA